MPDPSSPRVFALKAVIGLALLGLGLLLWHLATVLLLVFGAVVVASLLLTVTHLLKRVLPLSDGWALALTVVLLTTGLTLLFWQFGTQTARELTTLVDMLPGAYDAFRDWLEETSVGGMVTEQLNGFTSNLPSIASTAGALAMTATSGTLHAFLVVVGGIYFAAQPGLYRDGVLQLVPKRARDAVGDALSASGRALRLWLGGQLVAMALIGLLTWLGLWLLGVPAAFALALVAFVLDFVPIIGPVVAAIPGILLGFTVSPQVGVATLVLYVVIQQIESNVVQPLIQQRAVKLPPALLLFALIAIGSLQGIVGLLLAAPLTVVVYVLVKRLYVQELLDTPTAIPGQRKDDTTDQA